MRLDTRTFLSGFLVALWLAMLVSQCEVVAVALGGPPALRGAQFLTGILFVIPHLPGLLVLGVVCAVFRDACYIGHPLGTDPAAQIVVLLGDAALYTTITYWIAKWIRADVARRAVSVRSAYFVYCLFGLVANCILTAWMIWVKKPYYAHATPGFSILSLVVGVAACLSLLWRSGQPREALSNQR
jgi:hypothetical protein